MQQWLMDVSIPVLKLPPVRRKLSRIALLTYVMCFVHVPTNTYKMCTLDLQILSVNWSLYIKVDQPTVVTIGCLETGDAFKRLTTELQDKYRQTDWVFLYGNIEMNGNLNSFLYKPRPFKFKELVKFVYTKRIPYLNVRVCVSNKSDYSLWSQKIMDKVDYMLNTDRPTL